jgi:hypothetical protein
LQRIGVHVQTDGSRSTAPIGASQIRLGHPGRQQQGIFRSPMIE